MREITAKEAKEILDTGDARIVDVRERYEWDEVRVAEAELVPLDPGPVDVLKVAHHGSEDDGLPDLLAGTMPTLSLVSAGAGNPYGHPVDSTLEALEGSGSEIYRTDRQGTVSVLLWPSGRVEVETAR